MKNYFIIIVFILTTNLVFSQSKYASKYEFHYKDVPEFETDDYTLKITGAEAQQTFTKFKIQISNKSIDYLVVRLGEISFIYDFGKLNPKDREFIIEPGGSLSKVVSVSSPDKDFHIKSLSVNISGIYKLKKNGKVINMPDFQLPANKNVVKYENISCKLNNLKKKTDQTAVQFKCTYSGNDYLLVNPINVTAKIEDGREFAGVYGKDKVKILQKNDNIKFTLYYEIQAKIVDMQFAKLNIVWHNAFIESKLEPIKGTDIKLELDEEKTQAKNK